MIETREKRRQRTLLQRRRTVIIVSLLLAVVFIVSAVLMYNHFVTVFYYEDYDGVRYTIKQVNGVFYMYDKDGTLLPTDKPPASSRSHYITDAGTWVEVDPETGEYTIRAIPALEYENDGEYLDRMVLTVFKGVDRTDIRSVEINNENGSYTLLRFNTETLLQDDSAEFVIKNSPYSKLKKDVLSYLVYFAGHPTVNMRIENPIKDKDGKYSEYGLVSMTRTKTDENGNTESYEYTPASFSITTNEGVKHTMIIGDRLIDGSGYYVQYINPDGVLRDAVYVFNPAQMTDVVDASITTTLLGSVKELIEPDLLYPSTDNDYFIVENFTVSQRNDGVLSPIVSFSFVDESLREGTINEFSPYVFESITFDGYMPNFDNMDAALASLAKPDIIDITVLSPDREDKIKYGLMSRFTDSEGNESFEYTSKYVVSFEKEISFESEEKSGDGYTVKILQTMYISEKNERGNYYVFTEIRPIGEDEELIDFGFSPNTITEVSGETLNFLTLEEEDWVYAKFMQIALKYTTKIELISNSYNAVFDINESTSIMYATLRVNASSDANESASCISGYEFYDRQGMLWFVSEDDIYMFDSEGNEYNPSTLKSDTNALGNSVYVLDHSVTTSNGDLVYIEKDYITIQTTRGTKKYLRYQDSIFRNFFGSIITTGIIDDYKLSEAEEDALLGDESKHQLTIKISDTEGNTKSYSFYNLTSRKSYVTVDGVGGFYVQTSRINKIINDAKKFFAGQNIDFEEYI